MISQVAMSFAPVPIDICRNSGPSKPHGIDASFPRKPPCDQLRCSRTDNQGQWTEGGGLQRWLEPVDGRRSETLFACHSDSGPASEHDGRNPDWVTNTPG